MQNNSIEFVIDRIEGQFAVLRGDNELEINWPKRNMPKGTSEGDVVVLSLKTLEDERAKREKTAKEILKEILKDN